MIEVVVTTGLAQQGKIETARWLDRVCRLLFPGRLVLGGLLCVPMALRAGQELTVSPEAS